MIIFAAYGLHGACFLHQARGAARAVLRFKLDLQVHIRPDIAVVCLADDRPGVDIVHRQSNVSIRPGNLLPE